MGEQRPATLLQFQMQSVRLRVSDGLIRLGYCISSFKLLNINSQKQRNCNLINSTQQTTYSFINSLWGISHNFLFKNIFTSYS